MSERLRELERAVAADPGDPRTLRAWADERARRGLELLPDRPRRDPWTFLNDGFRRVHMLALAQHVNLCATLPEVDKIITDWDDGRAARLGVRTLYAGWWLPVPGEQWREWYRNEPRQWIDPLDETRAVARRAQSVSSEIEAEGRSP